MIMINDECVIMHNNNNNNNNKNKNNTKNGAYYDSRSSGSRFNYLTNFDFYFINKIKK